MLGGLTYSVSGAPSGFVVDSTMGTYSGTFTTADVGVYSVTVSVSDGLASGSKTFTLTVVPQDPAPPPPPPPPPGGPGGVTTPPPLGLPGALPTASLWIHDTADKSDDVILEGETASVTIVGTPNATVLLSISGPATLNTPSVTLDSSGHGQAVITPTGISTAVDDIVVGASMTFGATTVKVDEKALAAIRVTFSSLGQKPTPYNTLPATSTTHDVQRVPYKATKQMTITLSIDLSGTPHKVIVTPGQKIAGTDPGSFDINGKVQLEVKKTATVELKGTAQTTVGKHGNLHVTVAVGAKTTNSGAFSVSAWPVKLRMGDVHRNKNKAAEEIKVRSTAGGLNTISVFPYSMLVIYNFSSDSGNLDDLDQIWMGEFVKEVSGYNNPPWNVFPVRPAGRTMVAPARDKYQAKPGSFPDVFRVPGDTLPVDGAAVLATDEQWYGFRDGRSEAVDAADVTHDYQNDFAYFKMTRTISKTTVGGVTEWWYEIERKDNAGNNEPNGTLRIKIS